MSEPLSLATTLSANFRSMICLLTSSKSVRFCSSGKADPVLENLFCELVDSSNEFWMFGFGVFCLSEMFCVCMVLEEWKLLVLLDSWSVLLLLFLNGVLFPLS